MGPDCARLHQAAKCRTMPRRCCASAAWAMGDSRSRCSPVFSVLVARPSTPGPPGPWLYAITTTGREDASTIPAFGVRTTPSRRLGRSDRSLSLSWPAFRFPISAGYCCEEHPHLRSYGEWEDLPCENHGEDARSALCQRPPAATTCLKRRLSLDG